MELDILKVFIGQNVEIMVSGVWIEGHMKQIAKGTITLLPIDEMASFYGPTAIKMEVVQAIRQLKKSAFQIAKPADTVNPMSEVKSGFDSINPAERFKKK